MHAGMDLCRGPSIALENSAADFGGLSVDNTNDRLTDQFKNQGPAETLVRLVITRCQFCRKSKVMRKRDLSRSSFVRWASIHDVWKAHPQTTNTQQTAKR